MTFLIGFGVGFLSFPSAVLAYLAVLTAIGHRSRPPWDPFDTTAPKIDASHR